METDIKVVMHEFKFKNIEVILKTVTDGLRPNEKSKRTDVWYEDYWKYMDKNIIDVLRQMYHYDFELLGYPASPL